MTECRWCKQPEQHHPLPKPFPHRFDTEEHSRSIPYFIGCFGTTLAAVTFAGANKTWEWGFGFILVAITIGFGLYLRNEDKRRVRLPPDPSREGAA